MKKYVILSLLGVLLLFGCVGVTYHQKIEKDGTATIRQTLDFEKYATTAMSLDEMRKQLAKEAPEPDLTYSPSDYAKIKSPEEEGLKMTIEVYNLANSSAKLSPGDSALIEMTISNEGEKAENMMIEIKSKAIVNALDEYLLGLEKREKRKITSFGEVANVSDGKYELTVVATFDRKSKENIKVAKTVQFEVQNKQETPKSTKSQIEQTLLEYCDKTVEKNPGLKCRVDGWKIIIEKKIAPGPDYSFSVERGLLEDVYNVTITTIPLDVELPEDPTATSYAPQPTKPKKFKEGLEIWGPVKSAVEIYYVVEMPAKIQSAPGGIISQDKMSVKYNVLELYEKKQDIVIIAKEEKSIEPLYVGLALLVIMLIGGAVLLLRRKPQGG